MSFLFRQCGQENDLKFCCYNTQKCGIISNTHYSKHITDKRKKIKPQVLKTKPELKTRAEMWADVGDRAGAVGLDVRA